MVSMGNGDHIRCNVSRADLGSDLRAVYHMTPERILLKLTKRSTPATAAYDTWLAQGYSLADLTSDLMKLAMDKEQETPLGRMGLQP